MSTSVHHIFIPVITDPLVPGAVSLILWDRLQEYMLASIRPLSLICSAAHLTAWAAEGGLQGGRPNINTGKAGVRSSYLLLNAAVGATIAPFISRVLLPQSQRLKLEALRKPEQVVEAETKREINEWGRMTWYQTFAAGVVFALGGYGLYKQKT